MIPSISLDQSRRYINQLGELSIDDYTDVAARLVDESCKCENPDIKLLTVGRVHVCNHCKLKYPNL